MPTRRVSGPRPEKAPPPASAKDALPPSLADEPLNGVRAYFQIVGAVADPAPLPVAAVTPAGRERLFGPRRLEAWGVPLADAG